MQNVMRIDGLEGNRLTQDCRLVVGSLLLCCDTNSKIGCFNAAYYRITGINLHGFWYTHTKCA